MVSGNWKPKRKVDKAMAAALTKELIALAAKTDPAPAQTVAATEEAAAAEPEIPGSIFTPPADATTLPAPTPDPATTITFGDFLEKVTGRQCGPHGTEYLAIQAATLGQFKVPGIVDLANNTTLLPIINAELDRLWTLHLTTHA